MKSLAEKWKETTLKKSYGSIAFIRVLTVKGKNLVK